MSDTNGRFKNFFKNIGSYAKNHPWKTAAFAAVAIGGLLLVAGGIVLVATSPASFGGGAAAGVPLLAVGGALAAGAVVIVGGLAVTGTATGLFMQSAKKEGLRKKHTEKMAHVNLLLSESAGIEMTVLNQPSSTNQPAAKHGAPIKRPRKNKDKIDRSQLHNANLFVHKSTEKKTEPPSEPKNDKKFS